jgi:hypothetical protein
MTQVKGMHIHADATHAAAGGERLPLGRPLFNRR